MSSKINLKNMKEIYGYEIYGILLENIEFVEKNLQYLNELNFDDTMGLLEKCPIIFTYFPKDFKYKIDNLIKEIGFNYVEKIEMDIGLLEKLL